MTDDCSRPSPSIFVQPPVDCGQSMLVHQLRCSRHSLRQCIAAPAKYQRRWAQVHDVRFLVTHQQADKFTDKYRHKLQEKARQEGLQSVEDLKKAYRDRSHDQRKTTATNTTTLPRLSPSPSAPPGTASTTISQHPSIAQQPTFPVKSFIPSGLKTLSSYLDLPKTVALPPKEIEYVWRLRHASSPSSLCAVLPSSTYSRMQNTAHKHPQFILPLPREGASGAEIHFLQWSFPALDTATVVFTHLAEYKLRGEFSQPHTTITMHSELKDQKGLVLMQGQVVDGRGVSAEEARWLVLCLQRFYGAEDGGATSRKKLLQLFTQGNEAFRVEELVEEAEKIV
ncbi:MAG: hypothetical protein Q9218_001650 [Villophora microphyllina]